MCCNILHVVQKVHTKNTPLRESPLWVTPQCNTDKTSSSQKTHREETGLAVKEPEFTNCKFHLSLHPKMALAYQVLVVTMLLCKSVQLANCHKTVDQILYKKSVKPDVLASGHSLEISCSYFLETLSFGFSGTFELQLLRQTLIEQERVI